MANLYRTWFFCLLMLTVVEILAQSLNLIGSAQFAVRGNTYMMTCEVIRLSNDSSIHFQKNGMVVCMVFQRNCSVTFIDHYICGCVVDKHNTVYLEIKNVTTQHDDGVWTCRDFKSTSIISNILPLPVYYGPEDVRLNMTGLNKILSEGIDMIPVNCSADCNPPCVVNWYKESVSSDTLVSTDNGILNLPSISMNQAGEYICHASNKLLQGFNKQANMTVMVLSGVTSPMVPSEMTGSSLGASMSSTNYQSSTTQLTVAVDYIDVGAIIGSIIAVVVIIIFIILLIVYKTRYKHTRKTLGKNVNDEVHASAVVRNLETSFSGNVDQQHMYENTVEIDSPSIMYENTATAAKLYEGLNKITLDKQQSNLYEQLTKGQTSPEYVNSQSTSMLFHGSNMNPSSPTTTEPLAETPPTSLEYVNISDIMK